MILTLLRVAAQAPEPSLGAAEALAGGLGLLTILAIIAGAVLGLLFPFIVMLQLWSISSWTKRTSRNVAGLREELTELTAYAQRIAHVVATSSGMGGGTGEQQRQDIT